MPVARKSFLAPRFPALGSHQIRLVLALFNRRGNCKPRSPSSLGWFNKYDGNIIGGSLIGAGMALTGACPGTVYVQVASGVSSAVPALFGAALGGIAYVGVADKLKTKKATATPCDENKLTLHSKLNADANMTLLAFEAILVAAIIAASEFQPTPSRLLNPIVGGLGVGLSQLVSVALCGQALGVSTSYEEFGKWFWHYVDKVRGVKTEGRPNPPSKNIQFALSLMLGTVLMRYFQPRFAVHETMNISTPRAVLGGFLLAFGARLGGGCTSGHGISGMSLLSLSSFVSVAAMFVGGMGLGAFLL